MKDKFIIDRQFGIALWVDVEDGIVTFCYNEEPKFINSAADNYRLSTESPCIDGGTNLFTIYPDVLPKSEQADLKFKIFDLDGNLRLFNDKVDIGAYEYIKLPKEKLNCGKK